MAGNEIHYHFYGPQAQNQQPPQEQPQNTQLDANLIQILENHKQAIQDLATLCSNMAESLEQVRKTIGLAGPTEQMKKAMAECPPPVESVPAPTSTPKNQAIKLPQGTTFKRIVQKRRSIPSSLTRKRDALSDEMLARMKEARLTLLAEMEKNPAKGITPTEFKDWLSRHGYYDIIKASNGKPWTITLSASLTGQHKHLTITGSRNGEKEWTITADGIGYVRRGFKTLRGKNLEKWNAQRKSTKTPVIEEDDKKDLLDAAFPKGRERGRLNEPFSHGITFKMGTKMNDYRENK